MPAQDDSVVAAVLPPRRGTAPGEYTGLDERRKRMDRYRRMMDAARAAWGEHENALQILVIEGKTGDISSFPNDLSQAVEEHFLAGKPEAITAVLCIWKNGQIDVPSMRVRRGLLEADARNADALVYLQGEDGIVTRSLAKTV